MMEHNFSPASLEEKIVFGAARPGFPHFRVKKDEILGWVDFMQSQGIQRVCCLLEPGQLGYYRVDLLKIYREAFGGANVLWAPLIDFELADLDSLLEKILPFLVESEVMESRVVVHCSAGLGRTGQTLAAWLVQQRGYQVKEALAAVKYMGRSPLEVIHKGNARKAELYALLEAVR